MRPNRAVYRAGRLLLIFLLAWIHTHPLHAHESASEEYVICEATGEPVPSYRLELYGHFESSPLPVESRGVGTWTSVGPPGGDIRALTTDPFDNSLVLASAGLPAASDAGGVFKSNDGGVTWQLTSLYGRPVYGISASPSQPGVYWAAALPGLFRSTDYGQTWTPAGQASTNLLEVGVKQDSDDVIVIGISANNGIRVSWDGGQSFHSVGVNGGFVREIRTTPAAPDNFYLVGRSLTGGHAGYKSIDAGQTWTPIGLTGDAESIWIDPEDGDHIFVVHANGIHRTTNGGSHWTLVHPVSASFCNGGIVRLDGNMYASINGHGMFESTDGGLTWTRNNQGIVRTVYQGTATGSSAGALFAFNGGIHRTEGVGQTYNLSMDGLNASFIHTMACYRDRNEIWAGTEGGGVFVSTDGGANWEHRSVGLTTNSSWVIYDLAPKNRDHYSVERMLVSTLEGVYASDDFGDSWYMVNPPGVTATGVEIHPTDQDRFWLAARVGGLVHRTADGGQTWQSAMVVPQNFPRMAVGENPQGDLRLFITHQSGTETIFYSDDLGVTFAPSAPIPVGGTAYFPRLSVRPPGNGYPQMVYLATHQGIFKSADHGHTFTSTAPGGGFAWGVLGDRGSRVFSAGGNRIWVSHDEGASWEPLDDGLAGTMWTIIYGATDDELYAGSRGLGGYRLSLTTDVNPPPVVVGQHKLHRNFPSPFARSTTITYQLGERSAVKLAIFNALGRRVATLFEGEREAGSHETQWHAEGAPSGVYFYRMEAVPTGDAGNRFVGTKSMILLR